MGFGKKLKALREDKNLTQSELAQILGITLKTVSNYETKDMRPRKMEMYEKMANFFGVNINYLLTEEDFFIMQAGDDFGYMAGLFAGGDLPDEDKDALFEAIQQAYWKAKLENKKYGRRKKGEV